MNSLLSIVDHRQVFHELMYIAPDEVYDLIQHLFDCLDNQTRIYENRPFTRIRISLCTLGSLHLISNIRSII